jgi:hypothetical protein
LIEKLRTGVALILYPLGVALATGSTYIFKGCVWLTKDNPKGSYRFWEHDPND